MLMDFETRISPLTNFVDAVYYLRMNGVTFDNFNEMARTISDEDIRLNIIVNGNPAQKQLLEYQVAELDEFALQAGEFEQIEAEHYKLSNSQTILQSCQRELQHL